MRPTQPSAEQRRLVGVLRRVRHVRLDHADQAMAVAEGIIDHREIARLEDVERHLAARQQERARQWEYRNDLRKVGGPAIFDVDRHLVPAEVPRARA
ncbi:hypothetical protein ACVMII_004649 [Bradyrhizobium diazoefficiens]